MTRSVYVIGGAGAGKSTFTAALLDRVLAGEDMGELEDLHSKRNVKNLVVLRGHRLYAPDGSAPGLYLGVWRESFPGTDGLDRATSPCGAEWLATGPLPAFLVAEGATLATRPFMTALAEHTDLLIVHLTADDFVKELRFGQRGSSQSPSFVTATATRATNLAADMAKAGVRIWDVDSASPAEWEQGLDVAVAHLSGDVP